MYTLSSMPSTTSVVSAYTAFAASAMLARSILIEVQSMSSQLIPQSIRDNIISRFEFLFGKKPSSEMILIIDEHHNSRATNEVNEVYEASQLYLQDKISPCNKKLKVVKAEDDPNLTITVNNGEEIIDFYQGIRLKWVMISTESRKESDSERKSFELSFLKNHKDVILNSYLPYIIKFAKSKKEENRVVMMKTLGDYGHTSCKLKHPSTFDTLAMDPTMKKAIMDDLDKFVKRKEYYRRVGKAWKRGYLLYGPPGTGKSSLVAAMANYLKFHVYDVELTCISDNADLKRSLVSTENRSILVIEDIDCTIDIQNRDAGGSGNGHTKLTLSGLLNFIDGLWSSCGDERIILFTTNYKDKLDPALLRPGRMDMHIHMSYLTPSGFRVLAFNYLGISDHPLFPQIEDLIAELEITPAIVAEELLRNDNDDHDSTLELLIQFLKNMKSEMCKSSDVQGEKKSVEAKDVIQETIEHDQSKV